MSTDYAAFDLEAMQAAENYRRWILEQFAPLLIGKKVAEVGAGIGSNSVALAAMDLAELHCFEPAGNLFPQLQRQLGNAKPERMQLYNKVFEASLQSYDAVVYINVLEHIEDDHAEAAKMYAALRPGGYALILVPALPLLMSDFDRAIGHFRRYLPITLRAPFTAAGFTIERLHYLDLPGVLPWLITMRWLKLRPSMASVRLYDRSAVPIARRLERWIRPPIGKNLVLVARRPAAA
jgi:SAM-dependent methyltransferase